MEESTTNENAALWCDAGEHAFSPRVPGKEKWRREIDDPENPGQVLVINWLVCPEHKEELNKKFNTIRGEISTE